MHSTNCRMCRSGGIGRRARLKIVSFRGCGFDSHLRHKINEHNAKHCVTIILMQEVGVEERLLRSPRVYAVGADGVANA